MKPICLVVKTRFGSLSILWRCVF